MESILFAEITVSEQETLSGGSYYPAPPVVYNVNSNNNNQNQSQQQQQAQQQQGLLAKLLG